MNPENPIDPRQALEPSLTALLLGELPDEQARFVRQAIATDPELAKTFERLKQTTALVRETQVRPAGEPATAPATLRLSESRREALLSRFKTVQPEQFKYPAAKLIPWLMPAAAVLLLTLMLAWALLPALSRSKAKSMTQLRRSESAFRRAGTMDSAGVRVPQSGVTLAETTPARPLQEESLVRNKISLATSDVKLPQSAAGKDLDNRGGIQSFGLDGRNLATEIRPQVMTKQVLIESRLGKQETDALSVGSAPTARRMWSFNTFNSQSPVPAAEAPVVPGQEARSALTRNYGSGGFLAGGGGLGGGGGAIAPAQPAPAQTPILGDTAQLGRILGPQTQRLNEQETSQAKSGGRDLAPGENGVQAGAAQQVLTWNLPSGLGLKGDQPNTVATVTAGRSDARQLADFYKTPAAVGFDDSAIVINGSAQSVPKPGLQSESLEEGKRSKEQADKKLGLVELQEAKEKENVNELLQKKDSAPADEQEAFRKRVAVVGGVITGVDREAQLGGSIAIAKTADNTRELARSAGDSIDQRDLSAAKPASQVPVPQPEVQTRENAVSTFSLNVSDVSFKLAAASLEQGKMPDPASIRSEEFINAFDYRDPEPAAGQPVAFAWERAAYPFAQNRDLLRFSIKTAAAGRQAGQPLNLVLLLDNSGSMERADRVQIIHEALKVLATQLRAGDTLSVVTFARTARLWADGVPGDQAGIVADRLGSLTPQGGTNLEEAMNLAYQTARRHYLAGGINRVVLLTDGAANLGDTDPSVLKQKVESQRKQGIALDCFGIGWEGYNDDLLEQLTRNGDGRYGFLNTPEEASTEFAARLAGALRVAASDVKVQVQFNPNRVSSYRQIGYAHHQLTKEQFRDNSVNAAAIGASESGNALYEIETNPQGDGPIAVVRVRYRTPGTQDYQEREWEVPYAGNAVSFEQAGPALRLAGSAAAFSEWLATSPYAAQITPDRLLSYLGGVSSVYGADPRPQKLEWMIRQAKALTGK